MNEDRSYHVSFMNEGMFSPSEKEGRMVYGPRQRGMPSEFSPFQNPGVSAEWWYFELIFFVCRV